VSDTLHVNAPDALQLDVIRASADQRRYGDQAQNTLQFLANGVRSGSAIDAPPSLEFSYVLSR